MTFEQAQELIKAVHGLQWSFTISISIVTGLLGFIAARISSR